MKKKSNSKSTQQTSSWNYQKVINALKENSDEIYKIGMLRFGINNSTALGVSIPNVRKIAKSISTNQELSDELWASGITEAKILAVFIADSNSFNYNKCKIWADSINSWEVCDAFCGVILYQLPFRKKLIIDLSKNDKEFVRRAAFSTIAYIAFKDKDKVDEELLSYFLLIYQYSDDSRNFVKKAVNWAIRQIGKRNAFLNDQCISLSNKILNDSQIKRKWVASSALSELYLHKKLKKFEE